MSDMSDLGDEQVHDAGPDPDWVIFSERVQGRRIWVTGTVLVVLSIVFVAEFVFGATDDITMMVRMGALSPYLVEQGQWWRLGSATLLHGDLMHLLFNVYVLWALGSFLEKVLGSWRTLVLYCGSALGGSLVSLVALGDGISVGASGALFGFLGGHAVLAFRETGLVPATMLPSVRKAAVINLGLNVVNSLRPNIDWAAHAGGLVFGAGLVALVLIRGLPRLDEPDGGGHAPPWQRGLGLVGALWLAASLVAATDHSQAWEGSIPPEFAARTIEGLGVVLLPEGLDLQSESPPLWGRFPLDPGVISVGYATLDPIPTEERGAVADQIVQELLGAPSLAEGITREGTPELLDFGPGPAVRTRMKVGELAGEQVYLVTVAGVVLFEAVWLPHRHDWADLATRSAEGFELMAP